MPASELIDEWARKQGWSTEDQLALVLQYIDNQQDDSAFEDFLSNQAYIEEESARCFAEAETRNAEYEAYHETLEAE